MKSRIIICTIVIFMLTGCLKPPTEDLVTPGMSKQDIIEKIGGQPSEKRYITKRNTDIKGPEKKFWKEIKMGTKLEQWTFRLEAGTLKLYFTGDDDILDYKAFYAKPVKKD